MKLKWYLDYTAKNMCMLFFISLITELFSVALGEKITFDYMILWAFLFSLLVTVAENIIYGLISRKMSPAETDSLIQKLVRSDYTELSLESPSKVRYFRHNDFFSCYKGVIVYIGEEENTVYLSGKVLKEYE